MDLDKMLSNIEANTKASLQASKEYYKAQPTEAPASPEPVDVYKKKTDELREDSKKSYPKGSSAIVNIAVNSVVDGDGGEGLARAYKRARDDSDSLKARGERHRAELRRQQYMQEYFLPAVEIVANSASPDDVLANKAALKELDKYALLEGSGEGYTASYIRQAYGNQLGQVQGRSDPSVKSGVRRLNALIDQGQIRTALGVAQKLKKQIDEGRNQADDIDYELIGRVVAYYS